jgi:hypothetical protein
VGSNVVATGSGSLNLSALSSAGNFSDVAAIDASIGGIALRPTASTTHPDYSGFAGPSNFGTGGFFDANSGSGNLVLLVDGPGRLGVPAGYVSGTSLGTSTATWDSATFSSLGVTPGSYEWTWGNGATADSFTLDVVSAVPAPLIGRGLPVPLAVGGLLFGAKLLERGRRHRFQFG